MNEPTAPTTRTIKIKNRWTGAVMFEETVEVGDEFAMRTVVVRLVARGAVLTGAVLTPIRDDLHLVLLRAIPEVPALLTALSEGKVNGSVYRDDCGMGCLVGTLAIARGVDEHGIKGLKPNGRRPAERWFLAIQPGHTPATSNVAKLTETWVLEFMALVGLPIPAVAVAAELTDNERTDS